MSKEMTNRKMPIYMDYQATTPVDPKVLDTMLPYFTEKFGNPHSISHQYGNESEAALENARTEVASLIKAQPKEVYFTSGATESNNLALKGVMEFYANSGKNHLIITTIEHKCILSTAHYLQSKGFEVTYLPVEHNGLVNLQTLKAAIKPNTALVSVIGVHNEIGVIQPLKEIGKLCREHGVLFHTDGAQALGKIDIDVKDMNIDLMSMSGHKIYGPKGIGALYISHKPIRVRLVPQLHGGGQERGLRSGTMPTALCVGMGKACSILENTMADENQRIKELRDYFLNKLSNSLGKIYLNGDPDIRVAQNLNISFAGVEGESLILGLADTVSVSTGSACSSASLEGSYVLKALDIDEDLAHTSIRFGLGRFTTKEEIETVANKIIDTVTKLREMSPIWEMLEEGIDLKAIQWKEH
ncbi:IscS subfamily cysteine desulfurase [Rickettsiales bacterium LUAb2]